MAQVRFSFSDEEQSFNAYVISEWFQSREFFIEKLIFSFAEGFYEITNIEFIPSPTSLELLEGCVNIEKPEWMNTVDFWKY